MWSCPRKVAIMQSCIIHCKWVSCDSHVMRPLSNNERFTYLLHCLSLRGWVRHCLCPSSGLERKGACRLDYEATTKISRYSVYKLCYFVCHSFSYWKIYRHFCQGILGCTGTCFLCWEECIHRTAIISKQVDHACRKEWDSYVQKLETVEVDPETGTEVVHWVMKFPVCQ